MGKEGRPCVGMEGMGDQRVGVIWEMEANLKVAIWEVGEAKGRQKCMLLVRI